MKFKVIKESYEEDLDRRAQKAYEERDLDWFESLSLEDLQKLAELCQITKENPYGKSYDDEVFDAIATKVYTVHSGYNPDRNDTRTFDSFDEAVDYAFNRYNKYGEAHLIPPKSVSKCGVVVTGSENPETDYENIEEFRKQLKNFFGMNESFPLDEAVAFGAMKKKALKEELERYERIKSKSVQDEDGFWTDYTMYFDHNENKYVFVFGDEDIYRPEDGDFDWEEENVQAAEEWFDSYKGFVEDDLEESIEESTVETISESPMYAYLVTSDMTGMTFAMIHPDKERVTNATGQRMFKEWLAQNHYDETGEETEESRNAKDSMREEGYYLGWDEVEFGNKDWVEITNWDWNDDEESNPTSGWTAEIDGNLIPLEIVGRDHWRF